MTWRRAWMMGCLATVALVACSRPERAGFREPMPEPDTLQYRSCKVDADCVRVDNGCCQCGEGAENLAIARDQQTSFRARFTCDKGCREIDHGCSVGTVACDEGVCTYHQTGRRSSAAHLDEGAGDVPLPHSEGGGDASPGKVVARSR